MGAPPSDDPTVHRGGSAGGPPPAPRWVKVSLVVLAAVVLLALVAGLFGGGHGPGRHSASAGAGDDARQVVELR